jgi:hypothetical protein
MTHDNHTKRLYNLHCLGYLYTHSPKLQAPRFRTVDLRGTESEGILSALVRQETYRSYAHGLADIAGHHSTAAGAGTGADGSSSSGAASGTGSGNGSSAAKSGPPSRYVRGCCGNVEEATRRWKDTLQW